MLYFSVYCLYDDCSPGNTTIATTTGNSVTATTPAGLCVDVVNTDEVQGCVLETQIVEENVVIMSEYAGNNSTDCTETCRQREGDGVALSR